MTSFVYSAMCTPFGKFNGSLAGVRPDDLAAGVIRATPRAAARDRLTERPVERSGLLVVISEVVKVMNYGGLPG